LTKTSRNRRFALAAVLSVAVLALVPAALAAQAGKGGGSGAKTTGASLKFSSPTVVVGQQYQVTGSGFAANTWVTVGAHFPDTTYWASQVTDGSGNLNLTFTATSAGQVYHEAKQLSNNGTTLRPKASATLTVNP
jgi:hypothetical protein